MLYFHVASHPDVVEYTTVLKRQIAAANKEHRDNNADAGVLVKLAMVDCEKERLLAEQFNISPQAFPIVFFLIDGKVADRMIGVVPEPQIRDSILALVKYAAEVRAAQPEAPLPVGKTPIDKVDMDEENVMTLLHSGHRLIKDKKDFAKAQKMFEKALTIAEPKIEQLKKDVGLNVKKITPAIWEKMKKDPNYSAYPNILGGLIACSMLQGDRQRGRELAKRIRDEFPWAMKGMKDVAEVVVRVEMYDLVDYHDEDDTSSLMKIPETLDDPKKFYENKLRLVAAFFFERRYESAIEECLRLVRAELKLLPELKKHKVVDADASLSAAQSTPARKALFLIFDALGNEDELVIRGRKKMAAFMFA